MSEISLRDPALYVNRELSWLEFNSRVLARAEDETTPLLEQLKFIAIAVSNLDEFYMVRVAGLRKQRGDGESIETADRRSANAVLHEVGEKVTELSERIGNALSGSILPALRQHGVRFVQEPDLTREDVERIGEYYRREVHPCLTPIAIDPVHPFPLLRNRSLNLALRIEAQPSDRTPLIEQEGVLLAIVQVPSVLPRFVPVGGATEGRAFMCLEHAIAMHASELFPGHEIIEARPFRITRASEMEIVEEEAENLLTTIQDELRRRELGEAVRLEIAKESSPALVEALRGLLGLDPEHVHSYGGFLPTPDLFGIYGDLDLRELKDKPFTPLPAPALRFSRDLFRAISEGDILLHQPYESFGHVVDFIESAADDPEVVAIKQTLYRTSGDSPIVRALKRAAESGKQVTALVELKARFDEAANIAWARALEESGVHVVYGLLGLKTHAKLLLVIRREGTKLRRYLHLSTGNYNPTTARLYTDLSLMTANEEVTQDAMLLFNVLTGYSDLPPMNELIVSPFNMRTHSLQMIDREIEHAENGRKAGIVAKLNAIVDPGIIRALYRASQAGVPVELLVRGICCLKPGVPGVSDNIRVRAVVDRFLEHARIFAFQNGGDEEIFLSSADWMQRNLNRRIEVTFPVLDPALKERIIHEILRVELSDNASSWTMNPDGSYTKNSAAEGEAPLRAQTEFMRLTAERSRAQQPTVRREFTARSASGSLVNPALRVAELQGRRRTGRRS